MKPETPKQHLLDDLLQEDAGPGWRAASKEKSLAAFRQARRWKRVGHIARLALIGLVLAAGAFSWRTHLPGPVPPVKNAVASPTVPPPLPTLTDEQLLASFPANTCYLAEVDGRKILVFVDPALQKKYVH
jgi:hypothetical protein